jgi:hypothetical protein
VSTLSIDAAVFQFASSIVDPFGFGDLVKFASVAGQFGVMFQARSHLIEGSSVVTMVHAEQSSSNNSAVWPQLRISVASGGWLLSPRKRYRTLRYFVQALGLNAELVQQVVAHLIFDRYYRE